MLRTAVAPNLEPRDRVAGALRATGAGRGEGLRLCFIAETFHAGVGRHIADTIPELSRRGHEVHLLYSPIRYEQQFLDRVGHLPGVCCKAIPMPRGIGVADIGAFAAIRNYVRANGPFDAIHGHSSKGGGYARLLKLFGAPAVLYSPHAFVTLSPGASPWKKTLYATLERTLAQLTDCLICTSQGELDHALDLGIARRRLALVLNGGAPYPAPPRASVRAELGLSESDVVVGFVGRMEEQKAPERLVAAACELLPQMRQLKFLMIGDGPKRASLAAAMERAGWGTQMIWPGAVNARAYMPAMDIFVLPSRYEGFAYVLIEALYAGLPIVSTPVGGAKESVAPGVNGVIAPQDDVGAMACAIQHLAVDAGLRLKMAAASRAHAERFSVPAMVDALEHIYWDLRPARKSTERGSPAPKSQAESA
jgi:glycosyltransferase involved in cell wall biosynthesis